MAKNNCKKTENKNKISTHIMAKKVIENDYVPAYLLVTDDKNEDNQYQICHVMNLHIAPDVASIVDGLFDERYVFKFNHEETTTTEKDTYFIKWCDNNPNHAVRMPDGTLEPLIFMIAPVDMAKTAPEMEISEVCCG